MEIIISLTFLAQLLNFSESKQLTISKEKKGKYLEKNIMSLLNDLKKKAEKEIEKQSKSGLSKKAKGELNKKGKSTVEKQAKKELKKIFKI